MTVTTCANQIECNTVLDELQIREVFRPIPPNLICDGIVQIGSDCWIVGTNDRGQLTLNLLENASKAEAWKFFDSLHNGCGHTNYRISICGAAAAASAHN